MVGIAINGLDSSMWSKYGAGSGDVTNGIAGITAVARHPATTDITITAANAYSFRRNNHYFHGYCWH